METGNNFGPISKMQTKKTDKTYKKKSKISKKDNNFLKGLKKGFKIGD